MYNESISPYLSKFRYRIDDRKVLKISLLPIFRGPVSNAFLKSKVSQFDAMQRLKMEHSVKNYYVSHFSYLRKIYFSKKNSNKLRSKRPTLVPMRSCVSMKNVSKNSALFQIVSASTELRIRVELTRIRPWIKKKPGYRLDPI